jgi:hypothetical protein
MYHLYRDWRCNFQGKMFIIYMKDFLDNATVFRIWTNGGLPRTKR